MNRNHLLLLPVKKIKKFIILIMPLFLTAVPVNISANPNSGFAAGIIIGEPTGLTMKYNNFPVLGVGWSYDRHLHLHCDYWIYNSVVSSNIFFYAGLGGKYLHYSDPKKNGNDDRDEKNYIGLRIPVGVQFFPIKKIEIFAEIAPGMLLIPSTEFDLDAGIGVRYYF